MPWSIVRILHLFFPLLVLCPNLIWGQPYQQIRGVIHLDTTISGGQYDPEQMVRFLMKNDMEVAIFSDQITTRVAYGMFPVRGIMEALSGRYAPQLLHREGSVSNFGPEAYLKELSTLDRKYRKILVIPGVEVFPFYRWEGNLLTGLTLHDGYKHMLAIGMTSPSAYEEMPTIGEGFFRNYDLQTGLSLWPLVLIFFAFKCFRKAMRAERPFLYKLGFPLFLIVGVLFLLNNYPFKFGRYTAYGEDPGLAPYQDFIDYVIGRGGLVFYAHPEVGPKRTRSLGPIKVTEKTTAPYEDLLDLQNYTGFAAFYEGMRYIIPPGGIWDQVLTQYCIGLRDKPVWAIAEGDVEGDEFDPGLSQTVFLVEEKTHEAVLQSLKEGRIYAVCGPFADNLKLASFTLSSDGEAAITGQQLNADAVQLEARITLDTPDKKNALSVELIKNGVVLQTYRGNGSVEIALNDSLRGNDRLHYYRLDVRGPNQSRLLSNPIFVQMSQAD